MKLSTKFLNINFIAPQNTIDTLGQMAANKDVTMITMAGVMVSKCVLWSESVMKGFRIIESAGWVQLDLYLSENEVIALEQLARMKKVSIDIIASYMLYWCVNRGERWYSTDIVPDAGW
jgi:hypothetical protein